MFAWAPWGLLAVVLVAGVWNTAANGSDTTPLPRDVEAANNLLPEAFTRAALPPTDHVGAPGVVEPRERAASLSAEIGGVIAEILVQEGDRVEAGAPLLRLTDATERAALAQAEADFLAQQAQLQRVRGPRALDVKAAERDAQAARARALLSARQAERARQVAAAGAVTPDELDRLEATAEADRRAQEAAEARQESASSGRTADVALAVAQVASAQARVDAAKVALERRTLRASEAGEVLQVVVRPGEYLAPGTGAVVVGDTSVVRVRLDVDERDVGRVRVGQRGYVQADGFTERFEVTVVEVARRMGRKNVRTDDPTERIDTKILEVVVDVDGAGQLPQGLRVTGYLVANGA
jgi:HlyD family secretion protein